MMCLIKLVLGLSLLLQQNLEWSSVQAKSFKVSNSTSGCFESSWRTVFCTGNFNLSSYLQERRALVDSDPDSKEWDNELKGLEINKSNIERIQGRDLKFHGFTFESILIVNAPKLKYIDPEVLAPLKNRLVDFRAINTSLPPYLEIPDNPFVGFRELKDVYVGDQSTCPEDASLVAPCRCEFGQLWRDLPSDLYGTTGGKSETTGNTTHLKCDREITGDDLKAMFTRVSASSHSPKHFDVLSLSGENITVLPSRLFSNVSVQAVWFTDAPNLKEIKATAFSGPASKSIQIFQIETANFTASNSAQVKALFTALSSLTNVRILRIFQAGIPYIPSRAFNPPQGQLMLNLKYLVIALDRKLHKTGVRSVGTLAFNGAPNLIGLGLIKNFIERFEPYTFAFKHNNGTHRNETLDIDIGSNPFNDTSGLAPDAFSWAGRPLRITFKTDSFAASDPANDPKLDFMPENVFRPFIEEDPENRFIVEYFNVDIWCDCRSKWMFDQNGILKPEVQRALKIQRVENNHVFSEHFSVQCKAQSSFDCLRPCVVFPTAKLLHCGGKSDLNQEFQRLRKLGASSAVNRLIFSSKQVLELPKGVFDGFQFEKIQFIDATNLTTIATDAFGSSSFSLEEFSAENTSLTNYPNFGIFPNLTKIQIDESLPFALTSSNFNFPNKSQNETANRPELVIRLNSGALDTGTFLKLDPNLKTILDVGKHRDCSTLGCLIKCPSVDFKIDSKVVQSFLKANGENEIRTTCHLGCSCDLKWLYQDWRQLRKRFNLGLTEYFGKDFYCRTPPESTEKEKPVSDSDWGSILNPGGKRYDNATYFEQYCKN